MSKFPLKCANAGTIGECFRYCIFNHPSMRASAGTVGAYFRAMESEHIWPSLQK